MGSYVVGSCRGCETWRFEPRIHLISRFNVKKMPEQDALSQLREHDERGFRSQMRYSFDFEDPRPWFCPYCNGGPYPKRTIYCRNSDCQKLTNSNAYTHSPPKRKHYPIITASDEISPHDEPTLKAIAVHTVSSQRGLLHNFLQ